MKTSQVEEEQSSQGAALSVVRLAFKDFLAAVEGLPTTIFISSSGRVVDVHTGQYTSQSALDGDITHFALGR